MPFDDRVEARQSEKHGMGLFATADVSKGTLVWRFKHAPGGTCTKSQPGCSDIKVYTQEQVEALTTDTGEGGADLF